MILCIPAFFINLGKPVFIGDEAIRSLIALEMMISKNYIVPTMKGEFYFAKPPLYNWVLIFFFRIFGKISEFSARVPTVLFCLSFAAIIYRLTRDRFKYKKHSLLLGMMFLTCGRIIFYDSFLGLIDIFFSAVTFTMIILAYQLAEKGKWSSMYIVLYSLSCIGFMLKGLPSFHFLILTITIIHVMFGEWKRLVGKSHLTPLIIGVSVILVYFYFYDKYMDASKVVAPLVDQAARRTALKYDLRDVLVHIISYPFENLFHFLPWSLLGLLVFRKDIIARLKSDRFIWYCLMCFLFNYFIYWVSPEVFPRYILMLIPIIFIVWVHLYEYEIGKNDLMMKVIGALFKIVVVVCPILILSQYFNPLLEYTFHGKLSILTLAFSLLIVAYCYFVERRHRPMVFVIYILILRIGFDLLVLPVRASLGDDEVIKREAIRIGDRFKNTKLAILGRTRLNHLSAFYITNTSHKIIPVTTNINDADFFIIDSSYMYLLPAIDSFPDSESCGTRWVISAK